MKHITSLTCKSIVVIMAMSVALTSHAWTYILAPTETGPSYSVRAVNCFNSPCWIQERVGVNGDWRNIPDQHGTVVHFTNKPAGTYYYRSVEIILLDFHTGLASSFESEAVMVRVTSGSTPTADSLANQLNYRYTTRRGDFNGDGKPDLYVSRISGGTPGNGSLHRFILLQQHDRTFSVTLPTDRSLATLNNWPAVSVRMNLEDLNGDGFADMVLSRMQQNFPGSDPQIIFASGELSNDTPAAVRPFNQRLARFLTDLNGWIAEENYFETNAALISPAQTVTGTYCYIYVNPWVYYPRPDHPPRVVCVRVFWRVPALYTYSNLSRDAFEVRRIFDRRGNNPLTQPDIEEMERVFIEVLGVPVMDGPRADDLPAPAPDDAPKKKKNIRLHPGHILAQILLDIAIESFEDLLEGWVEDYYRYIFHYTNEVGRAHVRASGGIHSRNPADPVYLTRDLYSSGQTAKQFLALARTPTGYFSLREANILGLMRPSEVTRKHGQPGGGMEWTAPSPVPVAPWVRFMPIGP